MKPQLTLPYVTPTYEYCVLHNLFLRDQAYRKLLRTFNDNKRYYKKLKICAAVEEVTVWLLTTDISCWQSRLFTYTDIRAFALYLVLRFSYGLE